MAMSKYESNSQSVQELTKEPLLIIPDCYIFRDQELPLFPQSSPLPAIPIVDMETLTDEKTKDLEILNLKSACKEWGIFQLVNHGISPSLMEKLRYEIEEFFTLPLEEKMRYNIMPGDVEGYGKTLFDSLDENVDWADRIYMIINPIRMRKPHLFPELPSSLREILEDYSVETRKLAMAMIVKLMGDALNMEKKEIEEMFEDGMQSVRMTYYPPCPQPEKTMGLKPHSDATAITILLQVNGVDGLQVKKDGVWIPVRVSPDALLLNIGDTLEIISNGIYKSVEHRAAVNSIKERMSIGMFFNPNLEAEIGPATCLINQQNPPLFKRVTMENYVKNFFSRKLNGKSNLDNMKVN